MAAKKKGYRKARSAKDPHAHYHGSRKHSHPHAGEHHHGGGRVKKK